MRLLFYIFICTVGIACSTPALATKAQSPNQIALKLIESEASDNSLQLNASLSTISDFYQANARIVITKNGQEVASPVEIFSGSGGQGFKHQSTVTLPSLSPGRYRLHGTFSIYRSEKAKKPMRVGTNLFIDIRPDKVLSSSISFSQIERLELKAQMEALSERHQANDLSSIKRHNPALYKKMEKANRVQTISNSHVATTESLTLKATTPQRRARPSSVATIELSTGQLEKADPRKRSSAKGATLDKQNAVLETQDDKF